MAFSVPVKYALPRCRKPISCQLSSGFFICSKFCIFFLKDVKKIAAEMRLGGGECFICFLEHEICKSRDKKKYRSYAFKKNLEILEAPGWGRNELMMKKIKNKKLIRFLAFSVSVIYIISKMLRNVRKAKMRWRCYGNIRFKAVERT